MYKNIYLYINTYTNTHTHTHTGPPGSFLPFLVMQCAKPSLVMNLGLKMEIYKNKIGTFLQFLVMQCAEPSSLITPAP